MAELFSDHNLNRPCMTAYFLLFISNVSNNWKRKALAENDKKRSSGAGPYFLLNMEVLILEVSGKSSALVQLHRVVSESGVNPEGHQGHNKKQQLGRSNDVSASNWWR